RYVRSEGGIERVNNVFDAIGLGVFAVSGARIGMEAGFADNAFLVTFLGMTTAVGGGMIRDVLLQRIPFVLNKRIYAVAAIAGALTYWGIEVVFLNPVLAYAVGWLVTVTLRMLATIYKWNLPRAI
ncbi:MAG: TRIC cation channel family protein, partial [Clostridia bacterium]|nr:TRIC cation channel family protein [Clostridia bacterium]